MKLVAVHRILWGFLGDSEWGHEAGHGEYDQSFLGIHSLESVDNQAGDAAGNTSLYNEQHVVSIQTSTPISRPMG